MLKISEYYFPMMEQQLDKFQIPLELKYLSIVESNPKVCERSGNWTLAIMYPTGKEQGLEVTSYIEEKRPLTYNRCCEYFTTLYEMFGDWNLVLAIKGLDI